MVKIVYDTKIFDQEAFEAEFGGKRGVKPNWDYLEIALDKLENLWIDHIEFKKSVENPNEEHMLERNRQRNKISALESRFKKRL